MKLIILYFLQPPTNSVSLVHTFSPSPCSHTPFVL
jgi:hypothetical protein